LMTAIVVPGLTRPFCATVLSDTVHLLRRRLGPASVRRPPGTSCEVHHLSRQWNR
jgi:hypothetical protein